VAVKQRNPYRFLRSIRPCELALVLKWLLRVSRREVVIGNTRLWLDPASDLGVRLLDEGTYEPSVSRCLEQLLQPGGVFLDVGANEGWFTVQAARLVGPEGRVFSIEPQQRLWPVILRNLALNALTNCVVLPLAISSSPGQATLTLAPTLNAGASTLAPSRRQSLWRRQPVTLVALDGIAALNRERIALAKVDVEGYEVDVIRSATGLMRDRRIQRWLIETHPEQLQRLGTSVQQLESLLAEHGYQARSLEGNTVWELS
jgi:FkbM family methyltransferase